MKKFALYAVVTVAGSAVAAVASLAGLGAYIMNDEKKNNPNYTEPKSSDDAIQIASDFMHRRFK